MKEQKTTTKKYYKYEYQNFDTLPTFSSESESYYGKDGVSIYSTRIWRSIGQSVNTNVPNTDSGIYYHINFQDPTNLKTVTYRGRVISGQLPRASLRSVEVLVGDTWEVIWSGIITTTLTTVETPNEYYSKCFRFKLQGGESGKYSSMGVTILNASGVKKVEVNGTSTDYDHVRDINTYKTYKNGSNYKAVLEK